MIEIYNDGSGFINICPKADLVTKFKRDSYAIVYRKGKEKVILISPFSGVLYTSGDKSILCEAIDAIWKMNLKIAGLYMEEEYASIIINHLKDKYGFKEKFLMKEDNYLSYVLEEGKIKRALFAGGCFWCISGPFYEQEGVMND